MAYTDDVVKAKLSALNETQESIVTVAQWVMFHRRYAGRTARLWAQRLQESGAAKRLVLIYLANEVIQQSKSRRKEDFLTAFSPIIEEATATAYKGATNDVQQKIRRVVEVWKQRSIFEASVQDAVEARIDGLDKDRPQTKKSLLGGSLFPPSTSSAPPELEPLIPLQTALTRASYAVKPAVTTTDTDYAALTNPAAAPLAPPVHAARLSALLKSLGTAEQAIAETLRTRTALIEALEALVAVNRAAYSDEAANETRLQRGRQEIEDRKRTVEDAIMRGLSAEDIDGRGPVTADNESNEAAGGAAMNSAPASHDPYMSGDGQIERPDFEPLTPPPAPDVESFTPPLRNPVDEEAPEVALSISKPDDAALSHVRPASSNGDSPNGGKRRKVSRSSFGEEMFAGEDAMEGLDAEVVGMLG